MEQQIGSGEGIPLTLVRPKRNFSSITLKEAMILLNQADFQVWHIEALPRPPSLYLQETMTRLDAFDLTNSEAAKVLLIDALLVEVVPSYPKLRVWKAAPLESDTLVGIADYLIAPKRAYLGTPVLCAVEAKRDDFEQGRAQCIAEMSACQWNNRQEGHAINVFGIVSNGQSWQFFRLTTDSAVFQTEVYTTQFLPELLGALHFICQACSDNIAVRP
jgi:hypothetical protein